jgi:crotonobetainyl-CoA:carnitine CoA-transferase CaiB-like acyl-CoA transferase
MGATCIKLEPPPHIASPKGATGDPMSFYSAKAYVAMHQGLRTRCVDLKTEKGRKVLQRELERADVLVTSFRPTALTKLGLDWKILHKQFPQLCMVSIVGAPGARADEPGHDLTYMAENDLVAGLQLPSSLFADMGGALATSEAILQARLLSVQKGKGVRLEVALSEAAGFLGLPRAWGLTGPRSPVGGAHAGYQVYACKDGRVAVAALEPHFAKALAQAAGLPEPANMQAPQTGAALQAFFAGQTRKKLNTLASSRDIPLHTLT